MASLPSRWHIGIDCNDNENQLNKSIFYISKLAVY